MCPPVPAAVPAAVGDVVAFVVAVVVVVMRPPPGLVAGAEAAAFSVVAFAIVLTDKD